ncbi:MAG TPA: 2-hydroxyacyl-CoA dehydratase [Lachnospiraceae bacterium]|nr:2-hydroxyacyl-CoA dehydratase [Lachnospiraceae bacterium]
MKKYIETLGGIIEKRAAVSPERARGLLTAAYSWVRFSGKLRTGSGVGPAYSRMNSAVAGTIVDSFRHPKEAVMVNIFLPCELLHALSIQPMFPEGIAVYAACTACQRFFGETAEADGVPESFCSYHKTMLGMAESGVLPAPLMIANTTLACDANQLSFRRLAELYQVPHMVIDVPHDCGEEAVHYVADQLRALGAQLEEQCRRKLNPLALKEAVECSRRTIEIYRAYLSKRGGISLPVTMTGELCSMISTHVMLGRPESEDYALRLLRAAEDAPHAAVSGKKRIFWIHTLPNWQDSLRRILESGGRCELAGSDMPADALLDMDPERPYESMARRVVCSTFNGPASRRVEEAVRRAKEVRADGVVLFCHWGCKQTLGLSQLARQRLEEEGLPTLVLDGDGCDGRNVADGQMVTRVNAFLEQLEGRSA